MATSPHAPYVIMGFNNKSVLKEMEDVARRKIYEQLKDIIEIDDPEDFFIHEEIVKYHPQQYGRKSFPLKSFDKKTVYHWKNGQDIFTDRNVYVLSDCIYYLQICHIII